MFRKLSAAVLLGSTLLAASGCSREPLNYEVLFFVESSTATTGKVVVTTPDEAERGKVGRPHTSEPEQVTLPWKAGRVTGKGKTSIEVTPAKGAVTCRIVVEKKEVAKVVGKDGQPVTCEADVREE